MEIRSEAVSVDLAHAYEIARTLGSQAAIMMRKGFAEGTSRWSKRDEADWVTDVDLEIEKTVRSVLHTEFPNCAVVGEEFGESGEAGEWKWYIDPIDGTCNYANGIPWSSFSLCLTHCEIPMIGVLAQPFTNEVFHAWRGHGAFVDDKPLRLADGDVALPGGVVTMELANHAHWDGMDDAMRFLQDTRVTARIMGSSALSIVQVAAGRAVGAILGGSGFIDVSAAMLIAEEAGAKLRSQRSDGSFGSSIGMVAAHPSVLEALWNATFQRD